MGAQRPIFRPPYCAILLYRVAWRRCFGFNLLHLGWIEYIYLVVEPTHLKHMLVKLGNLPQIGVKMKKYLKPPPIDMFISCPFTMTMIQDLPENKAHFNNDNWFMTFNEIYLGRFLFNQFETHESNWIISPSWGEHKKMKPPPSYSIPITTTTFCSRIQSSCSLIVSDFFRSLEFWWETFLSMASLKKSVDFWTLAFTSWDLLKTLKG